MGEITLRGLVFSKHHTLKEFSEGIGWKRTKAWRIVNGKQKPNDVEIAQLAQYFKMDTPTFFKIFFPSLFTLCTEKQAS